MNSKFLKGTVILLATSLLLRGIGFFYQMLVVRFAGTEAVGILNMSLPFYSILLVFATAGMPVAIAKLTAGFISQKQEAQIKPADILHTESFHRLKVPRNGLPSPASELE